MRIFSCSDNKKSPKPRLRARYKTNHNQNHVLCYIGIKFFIKILFDLTSAFQLFLVFAQ